LLLPVVPFSVSEYKCSSVIWLEGSSKVYQYKSNFKIGINWTWTVP